MSNKNPSGIVRVLGKSPGQDTLSFNGHVIWVEDERVCLTDMWRAGGSDPAKRPVEWGRLQSTVQFVEFLGESMVGFPHHEPFRIVRDGGSVSTWAHWQLALAYAKYLSPAFHAWCNTVVRGHMAGTPKVPKTLAEALRLAADLEDERSALAAEVKELAPKAEFHDRVAVSDGLALIGDVGRALGYGRNTFFDMLREKDIIMQRPSTAAFQNHIDAGRFVVVTSVTTDRKGKTHVHFTSKVTGKGFVWLAKLFGKPGVEYEFPEEKVAS